MVERRAARPGTRLAEDLAAWVGMVPREYSTGGKQKLLGISKLGNSYLPRLFVKVARVVMQYRTNQAPALSGCLSQLTARTHQNVCGGRADALFFISEECPISNAFAREIARICAEYKSRGIGCELVYVDTAISDDQALKHAQEYGHGDYPKIVDRGHELVKATGVTVTPEVAVVNREGKVVYRGRIDDSFAALGQPRRPVKNADLRNALDAIVTGKSVEKPETKVLGCYIADFVPSKK